MKGKSKSAARRTRRRPEQTRAAILAAAMAEFSEAGVEGARTDQIARAADVNKALLYYYFKDKEALYGAVLDEIFGGLLARITAALESESDPRRQLLAYVGAHFDYVSSSPQFPRLVLREMLRTGRKVSPHMARIGERYFRPVLERVGGVLKRGMESGDFRQLDITQTMPSIVGIIVFYFIAMPVTAHLMHVDALSPELLAVRRGAVLDFVSAAVFAKPEGKRS